MDPRVALSRRLNLGCVGIVVGLLAGCSNHPPTSSMPAQPVPVAMERPLASSGVLREAIPGQPVENYPASLGTLRIVYAAVSVPMQGEDMRTGRFDLFQYELPSGNAKRLSGPDILNQTRFGNVITHNIHLSQDGKHLVFEANLPNEPLDLDQFEGANVLQVHLWHMDLATGKTRRFDTDTGYVGYPHQGWSPDGRFYVARRQEGFNDPGGIQPKFSWLMWDTRTWRQVPITKRLSREKEGWLRPFYGYEPYVSTSPDGTRAASVRLVGMGEKAAWTVQVKETSDGRTGYSIHVPRAQTPVFWTRDGKRLVFLSQLIREPPVRTTTWFLYVYDAKTGKRLHQQKLADRSDLWDYFLIPHWSRDGRWLISLSRERDGYDVILWNAATYDVRVLPGPRRLPSVISTTDWVSGIDWAELPSS